MKHCFIINPTAGKGKIQKTIEPKIKEIAEKNKIDYSIYITKHSKDAIEYTRKTAAKTKGNIRFYACGGDGTLYEVVNGAYGFSNAEVAVIPLGSGNDFIRLFGSKEDFLNLQAQIDGKATKLDLIRCGDEYAINQCSMGLDAEVCAKQRYFSKLPLLNGETSYILSILYCLIWKIGSEFTITIDDNEPFTQKVLFAFGGNSRWYGGGFMAAPLAMPNDGLLDFVVVKKDRSRLRLLPLIGKYKNGQHLDWDITTYKRGKKMRIQSKIPAAVNVDGETDYVYERTFEIAEHGMDFVMPTTSSFFKDVEKGIISGKTALPQGK